MLEVLPFECAHIAQTLPMHFQLKFGKLHAPLRPSPIFFEPIVIDGVTYSDGGTGWNNPTAEAIAETYNIWPDRPIGCLLSIGTGLENAIQLNHEDGIPSDIRTRLLHLLAPGASFNLDVAKYCVDSLTSCEKIHRDVSAQFRDRIIPSKNYFRLNVPQGMFKIGLEEWEKIRRNHCLDTELYGAWGNGETEN